MVGRTLGLIGGVLLLLGMATMIVRVLRRREDSGINPAILETFGLRVRAWWILFATLAAAVLLGKVATVILFGLISFWALREFITLTPTRPGDHRTLFWVFFLCTPLQFLLVGMERYGLYSILIPVYAFLFIPARIAFAGDPKRFLERTAKIQAGLLICVYCLSYAPALLTLRPAQAGTSVNHLQTEAAVDDEGHRSAANAGVPVADTQAEGAAGNGDSRGPSGERAPFNNAGLLLFFVVIVQLSDVLQYAWAQIPSRHVIVPTISPGRTWEGLLGGTASVALVGAALWWATPFPFWLAAGMSIVIALMAAAGGLTMSAIKRDRGVKDYGTLVEGHGGVLDRVDSICFAAPVFFHFTRWLMLTG